MDQSSPYTIIILIIDICRHILLLVIGVFDAYRYYMVMELGGNRAELLIGKKVQSARQNAGITQQTLCHKANLSYSTLAKIERGAIKSPSIFTIASIAEALDVSIDSLVGKIGPATPNRTLTKSKSGISFVYFDVNGCLVRFYNRAFSKLASEHDVSVDQIESIFWHYNDEVCSGKISMSEFNAKLAERLNTRSVDWASYYLEAAEPTPDMDSLLSWAAEHYKVGIITNIMPGILDSLMAANKIPNINFDAVIDSSKVNLIKPDQEMFKVAADKANTPVEEILLVDDTKGNLVAAEKLGWRVMWFDYARPDESISNVKSVLELP